MITSVGFEIHSFDNAGGARRCVPAGPRPPGVFRPASFLGDRRSAGSASPDEPCRRVPRSPQCHGPPRTHTGAAKYDNKRSCFHTAVKPSPSDHTGNDIDPTHRRRSSRFSRSRAGRSRAATPVLLHLVEGLPRQISKPQEARTARVSTPVGCKCGVDGCIPRLDEMPPPDRREPIPGERLRGKAESLPFWVAPSGPPGDGEGRWRSAWLGWLCHHLLHSCGGEGGTRCLGDQPRRPVTSGP